MVQERHARHTRAVIDVVGGQECFLKNNAHRSHVSHFKYLMLGVMAFQLTQEFYDYFEAN